MRDFRPRIYDLTPRQMNWAFHVDVVEMVAIGPPGNVYTKAGSKMLGVYIPSSVALYTPGNLTVGVTVVSALPALSINVRKMSLEIYEVLD